MDAQRRIAEFEAEQARSQRLKLQIGELLEQVAALTQGVAGHAHRRRRAPLQRGLLNRPRDRGRLVRLMAAASFATPRPPQPSLATEGGAFISAMYIAEEEARRRGLRDDALLAHRRARIRTVLDDFATWLAAVEPTLLPSDPLRTAVTYYRNHWAALTRFVDDPAVPIDSPPTERELQNVAKLRLNTLFAGSTEGAHRACVLLGIIATYRALGVPTQAYLTWAFERPGTHRHVFGLAVEQITPAAFKATLN